MALFSSYTSSRLQERLEQPRPEAAPFTDWSIEIHLADGRVVHDRLTAATPRAALEQALARAGVRALEVSELTAYPADEERAA